MPISVSTSQQTVSATVNDTAVNATVAGGGASAATVAGGFGATGPQGETGVVSATTPLSYNAGTKTISIGSGGAADGYVLTADGQGGVAWEVSSGSAYTLPTASSSVLGGVKIGSGVSITDGVISVSTAYAATSHAHAWSDITSGVPAALSGGYFAINEEDFLCLRSLDMASPILVETNAGSYGGFKLYSLDFYDPATDSFTTQTTAWTGTVDAEDVTGLATVATSGSYDDLDDLPTLFDGAYSSLTGLPTLGTAAAAASTDFAAASHNQAWSTITSTPTTLSGYGITDAASSSHTHTQLHDRSHAITSSSDHTATAWRVFYSDGSGVVTELALGNSGQALISNGASSAPSWGAAGSNSATDLTTGTLSNARLSSRARAAINTYLWSSFR
jgi:hypothetical protein